MIALTRIYDDGDTGPILVNPASIAMVTPAARGCRIIGVLPDGLYLHVDEHIDHLGVLLRPKMVR